MTHERRWLKVGLLLAIGAVTACSRADDPSTAASESRPIAAGAVSSAASPSTPHVNGAVTQRKIVRVAELDLEVKSPSSAQTAIERLAEEHGGYVVSAARDTDHGSAVDVHVTVVVRVPQAELTITIAALKRLGRGIGSERITSDDVTDEYVDLAARISSQKQLEQQYLEILKRAATVKDALEVQKQLAEVRTEIERMQGRQLLLDKESSFSTLTVHLSNAVPDLEVSTNTFGGSVRRAWSDGLGLSADLVTCGIRLVGVLVPVFVLLVVPSILAILGVRRCLRALAARRRRAAPLAAA